jgi:isopenicillin-N epimerase
LALIDHITSQTALVLPIERIVRELAARGVDTLVDGAHGPGMVSLRLEELGAAYYTGNCHKWLCAPKTVGLLHIRADRQHLIHPLVISHGLNTARTDRSRLLVEFGWPGTWDPTPALSVPESLRIVGGMLPGGWDEVQSRNRQLALQARDLLCQTLQIPHPCPDECIGAMASVPLPDVRADRKPVQPFFIDSLQDSLLFQHNIEVPVIYWPGFPKRLIRVCAQLYNKPEDYQTLAGALKHILDK